ADKSGFAGFNDKVDNHYLRTFGTAFMMSLFSAATQLSQPRGAVMGTYNSQQIMAAALGQQLGMLGMQIARRNLSIQPTLEIRPGYQFSIMVTRDIILPPWTGHPMAQANYQPE
ncbi:MAG: TrbI/VirB10 family protein, partial [Pseudomonadota bacterium]|nr:TrbI/VirB10 family protein [Pseudomonadota bacterium]